MSPTGYTVHNSGVVADQFRRATEQALSEGRLALFSAATRWMFSELQRTPLEFGESREHFLFSDLRVRCGFARPVYVEFGVHEPTRQVWLRKFRLVR